MLTTQVGVSCGRQSPNSPRVSKTSLTDTPSSASGTMTPPFACYNRPAGGNRVRGEKLVRHMESSPELSSEKRQMASGSVALLANGKGNSTEALDKNGDRTNHRYFDPIYDFYATGKLHVPKDLCFDKFMAELRFWAVSKSRMDECCSPFTQYCVNYDKRGTEKDHFIGVRCANVRRRLWLILEGHTHSRWWKAFEVVSTAFVVLSISALILGSLPEFQVPQKTEDGQLVGIYKFNVFKIILAYYVL
ncbi:hypothetical protein RB195_002506 [Necator americanus]|uniref:Potassium channel tetramerisation-type BTB domain-containing protein n=1 Tax=Necator americanus TaxID=51031 RepID=A0ABR1DJB9_NECAM